MMQIHHICIQTDVYEESLDFYTRILGFTVFKVSPDFHGRQYNTWLKKDQFMIELQTPKAEEDLIPWSNKNSGPVHLGFLVNSVQATYQEIKSKNYHQFKLKNGEELYQVMGEYLCKVKAPEGTEIEIRETDISPTS